ncbi:unnamed protein product [Vitrella brassicaformis CCMP3155]|uniref:t-SNARE coiled-coil homology domain-containing protein n=1 Tax=Vitrella brassicaformis (strain CCMP3155) TaxID=1169540 RepID=A0A0G4ENW4_VITBC|nr:unnamed protein product [Vitrella brassicaformis CCMP3155]|eukprot:CEL99074.1 unnamed protein product [Vitrella brassicaformis CCMP3155]
MEKVTVRETQLLDSDNEWRPSTIETDDASTFDVRTWERQKRLFQVDLSPEPDGAFKDAEGWVTTDGVRYRAHTRERSAEDSASTTTYRPVFVTRKLDQEDNPAAGPFPWTAAVKPTPLSPSSAAPQEPDATDGSVAPATKKEKSSWAFPWLPSTRHRQKGAAKSDEGEDVSVQSQQQQQQPRKGGGSWSSFIAPMRLSLPVSLSDLTTRHTMDTAVAPPSSSDDASTSEQEPHPSPSPPTSSDVTSPPASSENVTASDVVDMDEPHMAASLLREFGQLLLVVERQAPALRIQYRSPRCGDADAADAPLLDFASLMGRCNELEKGLWEFFASVTSSSTTQSFVQSAATDSAQTSRRAATYVNKLRHDFQRLQSKHQEFCSTHWALLEAADNAKKRESGAPGEERAPMAADDGGQLVGGAGVGRSVSVGDEDEVDDSGLLISQVVDLSQVEAMALQQDLEEELQQEKTQELREIEQCLANLFELQQQIAKEVDASQSALDHTDMGLQSSHFRTAEAAVELAHASHRKTKLKSLHLSSAASVVGGIVGGVAFGPIGAVAGAATGGALGLGVGSALKARRKLIAGQIIRDMRAGRRSRRKTEEPSLAKAAR